MADESPGVVITIKDIYGELKALVTEVRILNTEYKTGEQMTKLVDEDHEKRIRGLERWMYAIPASLLVAIISGGISVLGFFVKGN